jgi:hypothetical protein
LWSEETGVTDQATEPSANNGERLGHDHSPVVAPFLLGAAAGGLAGAVAALLLSGPARMLASALARRFARDDGDGLRFELLLQ